MHIPCISECAKDDRDIFVEWLFLFYPMCLIHIFIYVKRMLLSKKLNFVDKTLKYKLQKCFISCTQSSLWDLTRDTCQLQKDSVFSVFKDSNKTFHILLWKKNCIWSPFSPNIFLDKSTQVLTLFHFVMRICQGTEIWYSC